LTRRTETEKRDPFHTDLLGDLPDLKEERSMLHLKKDRKQIALLDRRIGTRAWPRMSSMLERIGQSWDRHAQEEDERARHDEMRFEA
jgi:hypothetical protein